MSDGFNRREFLSSMALAACAAALPVEPLEAWVIEPAASRSAAAKKPYGSGYFGRWITDSFGLPAYHYTCDQVNDPKAVTHGTDTYIRSSTDQTHQVGNDRLVAAASNYGYIQVRQDEGGPKFLNDYAPDRGLYGGGIGYLTDGNEVLSTFYPGNASNFDRIFGMGYLQKKVKNATYSVDQVIFAPFGEDPVMVSQVTIQNQGSSRADLRWIEYWGCQMYQLSYRSWMEGGVDPSLDGAQLRRNFTERFTHRFRPVPGGSAGQLGLLESKQFLGRTAQEEKLWQTAQEKRGIFLHPPVRQAGMDDLNPPETFLISLDAAPDGFTTNARNFFGAGGAHHPNGLAQKLDGSLSTNGAESAFLLERRISIDPGESRTIYFLYGYLPKGVDLSPLIQRYRGDPSRLLEHSSQQWKQNQFHFRTEPEPWIEREVAWSYYYLRSNFTYDSFFQEHIHSQGGIWQYVEGFQGAARDPLQQVLAFIYTDPKFVKDVLRYTLKEVRRDGTIPYGITGSGMPLPVVQANASDLYLWPLWVASEYVLATRDKAFLNEELMTYPIYGPPAQHQSVRTLLERCYRQLVERVGTGQHKLMRMLADDWTDGLVRSIVPGKMRAEYVNAFESVLNSAMASYVFDYYAQMLEYAGDDDALVADARQKAEENRQAVRSQWTGRWFRRAWLGPKLGWVGESAMWLGPQPWAIVGKVTSPEQARELVQAIDEKLRQPSPIGAMQISKGTKYAQLWGPGLGGGTEGAVWAALNETLIWALGQMDGKMAWDEWKKNTLARHAEVYPDLWYGIWSGSDSYHSVLNTTPGQTGGLTYPVMNMHAHACLLGSAPKLLGLEFHADGLTLKPTLPIATYEFRSPLLGFIKSSHGYEGWYAPAGSAGNWNVDLRLPPEERKKFSHEQVNGVRSPLRLGPDGAVEIRGESAPGKPMRWQVSSEGSRADIAADASAECTGVLKETCFESQ